MSNVNMSPELTPDSDEDRPLDEEALFTDEKLPSDVKLVLWSFVVVILLACSAFVVGNRDFRQARADAASSAPTEPTTNATASLPPASTVPPALTMPLAGLQPTGATPAPENTNPPAFVPPPSIAQAAAPVAAPAHVATSTVPPPTTVVATAPTAYPSAPALAPAQIFSPPPKHILPKMAQRDAGDLCPIALANEIRPGCNTFVRREIAIH